MEFSNKKTFCKGCRTIWGKLYLDLESQSLEMSPVSENQFLGRGRQNRFENPPGKEQIQTCLFDLRATVLCQEAKGENFPHKPHLSFQHSNHL